MSKQVERLWISRVSKRYGLRERRPVWGHEAAHAGGMVAGTEVVVAGFGVALFAFEFVVLRAGVGVRALAAEGIVFRLFLN